MERTIDEILADLFVAIANSQYGTEGNGQGYDVKIYGIPELKELLESLGLVAPESSIYTLQDVYDAVDGFHYNDSSNFATLQTEILSGIETLIVEYSPVIHGGDTAEFNINENTTAVATITAIDLQSDTLNYTLSGVDEFRFDIDATSGVLSFIVAPDFEMPADADGDNIYDVTVTVSDGAQTDSQDISVTVADVDEGTTYPSGPVSITDFNPANFDSFVLAADQTVVNGFANELSGFNFPGLAEVGFAPGTATAYESITIDGLTFTSGAPGGLVYVADYVASYQYSGVNADGNFELFGENLTVTAADPGRDFEFTSYAPLLGADALMAQCVLIGYGTYAGPYTATLADGMTEVDGGTDCFAFWLGGSGAGLPGAALSSLEFGSNDSSIYVLDSVDFFLL